MKKKSIAEYSREWRQKNAEKYREANRERMRQKRAKSEELRQWERIRQAKYYKENRERCKENRRRWYQKNRDQILEKRRSPEARAWQSSYAKKLRATNLQYKMACNLRTRLNGAIRARRAKPSASAIDLLGCSIRQFRAQLESQFTDGMTWEEFMAGRIHIDHIRPCASFDLTKESEQKKCFHHSNLQPLWAEDNHRKHAKWEPQKAA